MTQAIQSNRQISPRRREQGFTLMEVLIAVSITAIIGLGVWQVLSSVISSRDRVDAAADQFDQLQRALLLLERDITQAVNRPARNLYGDTEPSLTSRNDAFDLILTRQGWRNPLGARRSGLQRVAYEFTGEELRRRYWLTVDQGQEDDSRDLLLVSNLKTFDVEFLNEERSWVAEWPTQDALNNLTGNNVGALPMPLGIRVSLEHERFGELSRLYILPHFDQVAVQQTIQRESEQDGGDQDDDENPEQPGDQQGQTSDQPAGGSQ